MECNLTFLEACKALDEGRCKEIETEECGVRYSVDDRGLLSCVGAKRIKRTPAGFLGKWRLIDEKLRTEERAFNYWLVIWNDGSKPTVYYGSPSQTVREIAQVISLCELYTYTYPIC